MSKQTVVFDLDGTLTDYDYTNRYAIERVYEELHRELTDEEYDRYQRFERDYYNSFENSKQNIDTHGMSRIDYVRSKLYQELFYDEYIPLAFAYELMNIYIDNLGIKNKVYEGVPEALDYLASKYDLYIASNGPEKAQERKLSKTNLLKYFKGILSSEVAGYSKPHQEYFDYLFKSFGIIPTESVFIGDSLTSDIIGANKNGMYSIWYNRTYLPNTTTIIPNKEIHHMDEIKRIL
jgi:HAD superfamily hydrolase (TIGR01509 family)